MIQSCQPICRHLRELLVIPSLSFALCTSFCGCSRNAMTHDTKATSAASTPMISSTVSVSEVQALRKTSYYQAADVYIHRHEYGKALGELKQLAVRQSSHNGLTAGESRWIASQEQRCLPSALGRLAKPLIMPSLVATARSGDDSPSNGLRALILIVEYLHMPPVSTFRMEEVCKAGQHCSSMKGLLRASRVAGFVPVPVRISRRAIAHLRLPAIVSIGGNRYVAVFNVNGRGPTGTATVWDPRQIVPVTELQQTLLKASNGTLILLKYRRVLPINQPSVVCRGIG